MKHLLAPVCALSLFLLGCGSPDTSMSGGDGSPAGADLLGADLSGTAPDGGRGADLSGGGGDMGDPLRDCMMATLPRLTVVGNQLMIRCGADTVPTRLKGINRSGLQHKNGLQLAGFGADPTPELQKWRDQWKTVVVRLPIGQTYYLYYDTYRQDLAAVVAAAKKLGIYLILDLHGYDANNLNEAQPDPTTTPMFWAQVATAFGAETHVVFDIWNEPHDVPWSQWKGNAVKIIQAIRAAGANDTLIVVGGLDYAYDLTPLLDPSNRLDGLGPIIYATHPYPLKSNPPSMASEWDTKFGQVAAILPVLVGEYGVNDSSTSPYGLSTKAAAHAWMVQLHDYIDAHKLSALAWSAGDMPQITLGTHGGDVSLPDNPPDPAQPTDPFGVDVKEWMLRPIL